MISYDIYLGRFLSMQALTLYRAVTQHPNILRSLKTPFATSITSTVSDGRVRLGYDSHCYNNFFQPGSGESNLLKRMWCFPLIEKHEKFISVDFDSSYALEPSVPYAISQACATTNEHTSREYYLLILTVSMYDVYLFQDNSAVKALFVLVDPVERMFAHYRQLRAQFHLLRCGNTTTTNTTFPSFEDLALEAMQYSTVFSQVREMVTNGTALDFIVHYYFQQLGVDVDESVTSRRRSSAGKDPCGERRATGQKYDMNSFMPPSYSLFANSVYFPAIVHYLNKLGPDRVRIVYASSSNHGNGENSSTSSAATTGTSSSSDPLERSGPLPLQDIANEVFQFLELCPFEILITDNIPPSLTLNNSDVPTTNDGRLHKSEEDDDYDNLFERNHSRADRSRRPTPSNSGEEGSSVSMSRDIFRKLSAYFAPLQLLLTNVTGYYNISIGSPPPFPSPLLSGEYSASSSNDTLSLPLLWFEDQASDSKDDTTLIGRLMPKLIPQR